MQQGVTQCNWAATCNSVFQGVIGCCCDMVGDMMDDVTADVRWQMAEMLGSLWREDLHVWRESGLDETG